MADVLSVETVAVFVHLSEADDLYYSGVVGLAESHEEFRARLERAEEALKTVNAAFVDFQAAQKALDAARFQLRLSSTKYCPEESRDFIRADRAVDAAIARLRAALGAAGER